MSVDKSQSSSWSNSVTFLCCIAAAASVIAIAFLLNAQSFVDPGFTAYEWIRVGGGLAPFHVPLRFEFSPFAMILFCSVALVLGTSAWQSNRLTCLAIAGCLGAAFVMLFATNLVVWYAGWTFAALCSAVVIGNEDRTAAPLAARRFLTASVFLDGVFLLLVATVLDESWVTGWDWSASVQLDDATNMSEQDAGKLAQVISFYLPISLLARMGVFPFHGWTSELSASRWQTFAVVRCGLFASPALLLLTRFSRDITYFADEPSLIVAFGTLTILVGSASSLLRANPMSALNGVMTSSIGLLFILSMNSLLFGFLAAFMPLVVAATIGLQNARSDAITTSAGKNQPANDVQLWTMAKVPTWLLLLAFVYGCGRFIDRGIGLGGQVAVFAFGLVGLLAAATAIVRVLLLPSEPRAASDAESNWRTNLLVGFAILVTVGMFLLPDFLGRKSAPIIVDGFHANVLSLADPIVLGLALTIGWTLFRNPSDVPSKIVKGLGPIGRLAKQGFYIDDAVFFLLTMPLRGLGQVARLTDWLVIDNMVVGVPSKYPAWIAKVAAPLRQPSAGLSLLSTCVGLGVMLVIVVWLWS